MVVNSKLNQHKVLKQKQFKITDTVSGNEKKLSLKSVRLPSGVVENFFISKDNDSVQVFAITHENEVITVLQWRPGIEAVQCELPGGRVDKGEDHKSAVRRELLEETGYVGELTFLGECPYNPYSSGVRYMYVANNCVKAEKELDLDPNEFLEVKIWSLENFKVFLSSGRLRGMDLAYLSLEKLDLL